MRSSVISLEEIVVQVITCQIHNVDGRLGVYIWEF
jgi:hypothetical protein